MRSLIALLWRNNFSILFFLLLLLSLGLLTRFNRFHNSNFLGFSNALNGAVSTRIKNFTEYLTLSDVNEILMHENAKLKSRNMESLYRYGSELLVRENEIYRQQYSFQAARIVNSTTNKRSNYILIDRGSAHGVETRNGAYKSLWSSWTSEKCFKKLLFSLFILTSTKCFERRTCRNRLLRSCSLGWEQFNHCSTLRHSFARKSECRRYHIYKRIFHLLSQRHYDWNRQ